MSPDQENHTRDGAQHPTQMRRQRFGTAGRDVPVIGQGSSGIERRDPAFDALRRGLDLGLTHIDTSELYGDGAAEELVGGAIAGRRDEVFLVSKVLPGHASFEGTIKACEDSLKRLRTDRLDCYLLQWRGPSPLEATFGAFDRLREQGKILSWGVSNFDVPDLEAALAVAGDGRIACNQVLYHLDERTIEQAVLPWCEAHGLAVVAYSPFGHGKLAGPATPRGRVLEEVSMEVGATPHQVALAFLVRRASVFAIPKASLAEQTDENAAAGRLQLSDHAVTRLNNAFPLVHPPRPFPMLSCA